MESVFSVSCILIKDYALLKPEAQLDNSVRPHQHC
jgi:hypothetical protein